jgi:uncharacterized protein (DUF433 family)
VFGITQRPAKGGGHTLVAGLCVPVHVVIDDRVADSPVLPKA